MKTADQKNRARSGAYAVNPRAMSFSGGTRAVLDSLREGCQVIDHEFKYVYVNDAAAAHVQRRKEELLGRPMRGCFPGIETTAAFGMLERCMAKNERGHMQSELVYADGSTHWFELRFIPVTEGVCLLSADITSSRSPALLQRTAEDQNLLAEVGATFAATLEYDETCQNVAELCVRSLADFCSLEMLDDAGEVRRLKVAHREPEQKCLAATLQRMHLDLRQPHLGSRVIETGERMLLNQVAPAYIESISQNATHHSALLELGATAILGLPLHAHGKLVGALILVRTAADDPFTPSDIQLAAEVARRAALAVDNARLYQRACGAIRTRDDVLGIVAHDLRNPLHAMLLHLRLLRRAGQLPERRSQESLKAVLREGARIDRMIQDLLDVVRVESGTFSIQCRRLFVGEIAKDAIEAYRLLAREESVDLVLDAEPADVELFGDGFRIHQALGNVIGNAIKFTPAGGTVTVTATNDGVDCILSVADGGPGIAPDQVPHLFDRFWQAHSDHRGTGLGLSIAKSIVDAHGGRIWVESRVGAGSTFSFALPLSPRA